MNPSRLRGDELAFASVAVIVARYLPERRACLPIRPENATLFRPFAPWRFSVTTDAGTGTPTVTLKQSGDTLTGHYSSQVLGEADLKGTTTERKFTFTFRTEVQGTPLVVTYTGTIDSNDAIKGTLDLGGMGSGSFTGKRQ